MKRLAAVFVIMLVGVCAIGFGQAPPSVGKPTEEKSTDGPKPPDWVGLKTLLESGAYAKAKDAADVILGAVKTDRKAPDFLPRCIDTIDALMCRGFAESQIGELDAADASFSAADDVFKDRDFQKQLAAWEKKADQKAMDPLIDLDLRHIEIRNRRSAVFLERLRRVHAVPSEDGASVPGKPSPSAVEAVGGWIEGIRGELKSAADTRKKIAERFEKGSPSIVGSPHKRALMSTFHPHLIEGLTAFEVSCLPFTMPSVPATENAQKTPPAPKLLAVEGLNRAQLVEKTLVHFAAASQALDAALEAAVPKGTATAPADKRLEADVLRLQLLLARCEVLVHMRDRAAARKDLDEIFKLHKDLSSLRKLSNADSHPHLLLPQLFATELALVESEGQFMAGMMDEARVSAIQASKEHAKAAALPHVEHHVRRDGLARLASAIQAHAARLEASIATTDAAEVGARRIRRAVEATAAGY